MYCYGLLFKSCFHGMQFTQSSSMHMVAFQNRESCEVFPGREAMCKHLIRKNKLFSTKEVWNVQLIKTSHPTFLWQQKMKGIN